MPALAELKAGLHYSRRAFLASAGSLAAAACGSLASSPPSGEKQPLPTAKARLTNAPIPSPTPLPEIVTTLENKPKEADWATKITEARVKGKPLGSALVATESSVLARDEEGVIKAYAPKPEKGKRPVFWKTKAEAVILAADKDRALLATGEVQLILVDTKTGKQIAVIDPHLGNVPNEKLLERFVKPPFFVQELLVVPTSQIAGIPTYDGISVYNKSTGELKWETRQGNHFKILEAMGESLLIGKTDSGGKNRAIQVFDLPSGQSRGEEIPTITLDNREDWAWARMDNLLFTYTFYGASNVGNLYEVAAYDLNNGNKLLEKTRVSPGVSTYYSCTFCDQKFGRITTNRTRTTWIYPPGAIEIRLEAPIVPQRVSEAFGYTELYFTPANNLFARRHQNFTTFPSQRHFWDREDLTFSYIPTSFVNYETNGKHSRSTGKESMLFIQKEGDGMISFIGVHGVELIGKYGDTLVFASWSEKRKPTNPPNSLRLYGINNVTDTPGKAKWEVDLQTLGPVTLITHAGALYSVGPSIVKIDPISGNNELYSFIGTSAPKAVAYSGSTIEVQTADSRLLTYVLPKL